MNEVAVVEGAAVATQNVNASIFAGEAAHRVVAAQGVANALKPIIQRQELTKQIGSSKKEHVLVEGWCVLFTLLGVFPDEEYVKKLEDGVWEAKIALINSQTGKKIGSASSICSRKERRWKGAEDHAVRNMAITRATGRVGKQCFGWIMDLAGYASTAAEEYSEDVELADEKPIGAVLYEGTKNQLTALQTTCAAMGVTDKGKLNDVHFHMKGRPMTDMKIVIDSIKESK